MIQDMVFEITPTTGTDPFVPGGARSAPFRTIASAHQVGDRVYYTCYGGTQFETGRGTWNGTALERTEVFSSSAGYGVKVNFAAGNKDLIEAANSGALLDVATLSVSPSLADNDTLFYLKADKTLGLVAWGTIRSASTPAPSDTIAPAFSSAQVANATPTVIQITMSETLANSVPLASAFTVSGGKTVNSVAVSGAVVSITVNSAYVSGDVITVTYTKPGANPRLQDAAGNAAESFGPSSVTNNIGATITAPGAPTIGTLTAGNGSVSQAFTAPASNGGAAITGYTLTIYRVSDNTVVTTATGASSPISATVANGLAVYGKVKATNSVDTGPESAASNSVTPAAPAQTGLTAKFRTAPVTTTNYNGNSYATVTNSAGQLDTYIEYNGVRKETGTVRRMWGDSYETPPTKTSENNRTVTYLDTAPVNNPNDNQACSRIGGTSYPGNWNQNSTTYVYGGPTGPKTKYLWHFTEDNGGSHAVTTDSAGNPVAFTVNT